MAALFVSIRLRKRSIGRRASIARTLSQAWMSEHQGCNAASHCSRAWAADNNAHPCIPPDAVKRGVVMKLAVVFFMCVSSVACFYANNAQAESWACYAQNTWTPNTGMAFGWKPQATRELASKTALANCKIKVRAHGTGNCTIRGCDTFDSVEAANASACQLYLKYRVSGGKADAMNCK